MANVGSDVAATLTGSNFSYAVANASIHNSAAAVNFRDGPFPRPRLAPRSSEFGCWLSTSDSGTNASSKHTRISSRVGRL